MTSLEETGIARAVRFAGSQTALAQAIGVTPQAVQKWVAQGVVPHERCRLIEQRLGERVTRYELNPRVFGTPAEAMAVAARRAETQATLAPSVPPGQPEQPPPAAPP